MTTTRKMFELVIYFSEGDLGWDEGHNLEAENYADARVAAAKIISFRRLLSPVTVLIIYASVRRLGKPRDGLPVKLNYPLVGTAANITDPVAALVNTPHDAFYYRLGSVIDPGGPDEQALAVTGYVRGLPDDVVNEGLITDPGGTLPIVPVIPGSEPASAGTPADYAHAIGDYLKVLVGQTRYSHDNGLNSDDPPVKTFRAEEWDEASFRGYTNRKCGKPFNLRPGRAAAR